MIELTPIQWALMALAGFLTGMSKTDITALKMPAPISRKDTKTLT